MTLIIVFGKNANITIEKWRFYHLPQEEKAKELLKDGDFENSIKAFEKFLKEKNDADTWNNLGVAYSNMDDFTKAVECFNKALESNPNHFNALNNLGVIHVQEGKFKEAISFFQKALKIKPEMAAIWENLAECHERLGNFSEANTYKMNAIRCRS